MHFEYDLVPKRRKRKKQRPSFDYGNRRNLCDVCMLQDQPQPDCCCHIDEIDDHCEKDCICGHLQNLGRGTIVILSTTSLNINDLMAARFIHYDKKTRCATFRVLSLDLILRCRDIKAIIL